MSKNNAKATNQENSNDFLKKIDSFCKKKEKLFFIISLLLTVLFSALLFNPLVSVGGDDSAYIIKAFRFVKNFDFPTFQGPLYPIVLSPFILIFGLKIVLLKILSIAFIIGHLYFFHKTFKDKIPASIHAFTLILLSVNSSFLYFAYQTYVEAFFLFIQSIGVWYFVKYFIDTEDVVFNFKRDYKKYLLFGMIILLMGLTRSVGYAFISVILIYFIIYKKWSSILPALGSFGVVYGLYSLIKKLIWGISGADFSGQGAGLLYKNYYNPAEGKEDLAGFFQRLIDNSNLYLSKHLYIFLGLRKYEPGMKVFPWLTVLTYLLFFVAIILVIRKNKHIFFAATYVGILCFVTFIIIQKSWDQDRLIIPYFPMILITLLGGIYFLFNNRSLKKVQWLLPIFLVFILFLSFRTTTQKVKQNSELKGPWYGLTPDWVNFIKCSKWADRNLPKEVKIASRKPSISFVYSKGREFVGIFSFKTMNSEEVLNKLKDSVYVVTPFNTVFRSEVPPQLQAYLRYNTAFILNNNGSLVGIFKPELHQMQQIQNMLGQASIEYSVSPLTYYHDNKISPAQSYIVSPDSLLAVFQRNDVEYLIDASLRVNPYVKTDRTINTIERYRVFIEQKYPGIFEKIVQLGENNDEPASLYRIKYEMYGLEK